MTRKASFPPEASPRALAEALMRALGVGSGEICIVIQHPQQLAYIETRERFTPGELEEAHA